jgi:hypothetical protein
MSTTVLYARKEVSALPGTLVANTIYAIRRSTGFDLYITDNTGLIAHKINNTDDPLKSPVFTHTTGKLTGVSYSDGSTKVLSYTGELLTKVDLLRNSITTRKVFTYSGDTLINIVETTL